MKTIKAGEQFPPSGTPEASVLSVGASMPSAVQVRAGAAMLTVPIGGQTDLQAELQVQCFAVSNPDGSVRCAVAGPVQQIDIAPGSILPLSGPDGWMSFQISDVVPPAPAH
jgi:hypothetical protein